MKRFKLRSTHHASLALKRRLSQGLTLFWEVRDVVFEAVRWKAIVLEDTI